MVTKNIEVSKIKGIGFDATCSLVAIGADGCPVTVSPTGNHRNIKLKRSDAIYCLGKDEQNVVLWMDHRANQEADFINNLNHPVLKYVGSKISLEMETPKLMWLKKHLETDCWNRTDLFFDLPDFLTWKATGSESRYNFLLCLTYARSKTRIFHTLDLSVRWSANGPTKQNRTEVEAIPDPT